MNPDFATTTWASENFSAGPPAQLSSHENAGSVGLKASANPVPAGVTFRNRHRLFMAYAAFLVAVFASMAAAATVASNHVGC